MSRLIIQEDFQAAAGKSLARTLRRRFRTSVPSSQSAPHTTMAPVIVFGMGRGSYSSSEGWHAATRNVATYLAVHPVLKDLLHLLELERIEDNIFRGESRDIGSLRVFGGQVLGQALTAASYTVTGRAVHSLHAYFLRGGDVDAPIVYEVDRARDGRSFSNRRVVGIQHGRPIFNMAASFQKAEAGLEHQASMPEVPGPDELTELREMSREALEKIPETMRRLLTHERPFEVRPVEPISVVSPTPADPIRHYWLKTVDQLPSDPALHRNLLAYLSDHQLVATATLPHGLRFELGNVQLASLDHAMWFHRPVRVDEWMLYSMHSPQAGGARGLALGQFFTHDGTLVASTAQEGLVRVWPRNSSP